MDSFIESLWKTFFYSNGELYRWKKPNEPVGWFDEGCGYKRFKFKGKTYLLHRMIYYICNGYLPELIDHIDQNKLNNEITNLRACSYKGDNASNSKRRTDNTSGHRGVTWHKATQKWMSSVYFKGKRYHLGVFEDKIEAAKIYNEKAKEVFGEFAILNKV